MSFEKGNIEVTYGSERGFGLVFAVLFTLIGLYPLIASREVHWWSLGVALALLIVTFARPSILKKPNYWWFRFGMFLGGIIAPIIMALVYITTVVPIGLIMRLSGKDLLHIKIDKNVKSYWIKRESPPQPMKNQF